MASPSSHHSVQSNASNLQAPSGDPAQRQQRRMTSPALSTSSLSLPEGHGNQQPGRPSSPLRNGFVPDNTTFTGIVHDGSEYDDEDDDDYDDDDNQDDDDRQWGQGMRSQSPASSVSQLAANFAQRVGTLVHNIAPRSPGSMPTAAEIEAEAERERDRGRREAERILTAEADERRLVEERVLALMESTRGSPKALPPPPTRSQTLPNPPSPSTSQKENSGGWWAAAKSKLTPTKEPLTPAQQVIHDAKAREKDKKGKGKEKDKEWPANTERKFTDPAFLNLNIPVVPQQRRPVPTSPSSPTPSRPNLSNLPPNLTPSPMRSAEGLSSSPSREPPPLYAQFNNQGTLDVPGTLLTIAKRFEKLEKWTVGHVRALEERMSDVERWLVDKEREKEVEAERERDEKERGQRKEGDEESRPREADTSPVGKELHEIKQDVAELQGRLGALGREMAKLATAPANLSPAPSRPPPQPVAAPQTTSSIAVTHPPPHPTTAILTTPHSRMPSLTARESTSPPMASASAAAAARSRLPYPTGDYASPPGSGPTPLSPTSSPPSSITSATRTKSLPASGLPGVGLGISSFTSYSSSSTPSTSTSTSAPSGRPPRATSPPSATIRAVSPSGLPTPRSAAPRPTSVSPTPRKRYTVALGGPIVAPPSLSSSTSSSEREREYHRAGTPVSFQRPVSSIGTAFFSSSGGDEGKEKGEEFADETIGKSSAARFVHHNHNNTSNSTNTNTTNGTTNAPIPNPSPTPSPTPSTSSSTTNLRIRPHSVYGLSSLQPPTPSTPLTPRLRSRSTTTDGSTPNSNNAGGKFVDPLVLRKQERGKIAMPKPVGKVPIGQLVAFFDGDR